MSHSPVHVFWGHLPNTYLHLNFCPMVNIWENPNKKVGNELKWPGGEMEAWESMAGAVELGDRGFEPGV